MCHAIKNYCFIFVLAIKICVTLSVCMSSNMNLPIVCVIFNFSYFVCIEITLNNLLDSFFLYLRQNAEVTSHFHSTAMC